MPPWPSRLKSASGIPSSRDNTATSPLKDRDKQLPPRPRQDSATGPATASASTNGAHCGLPSPTRTSSPSGQEHAHSRSASHPLPRVFGRKKSLGMFGTVSNSNMPTLDESQSRTPAKVFGSKRKLLDEDPNDTRQCVCCFSKVRFPRGLQVFRCTTCLTINDLEPFDPSQKSAQDTRPGEVNHAGRPEGTKTSRPMIPLSVERTRAIISQCLVTYLEAKASREQGSFNPSLRRPVLSDIERSKSEPPMHASVASSSPPAPVPQIKGSSACPRTRSPAGPPSATIREHADFDQFAYLNHINSSSMPPPQYSPFDDNPQSAPQTPDKPSLSSPIRKPVPLGDRPNLSPPRPNEAFKRMVTLPNGALREQAQAPTQAPGQGRYERVKKIFRPLEEYMQETYGSYKCLNSSFSTTSPRPPGRPQSESAVRTPPSEPVGVVSSSPQIDALSHMDAKTLLLGDFAENGSWWMGRLERNPSEKEELHKGRDGETKKAVNSKSPGIDWDQLDAWYSAVHNAGQTWWEKLDGLSGIDNVKARLSSPGLAQEIDAEIAEARENVERTLLKITENLLKRPTRPLREPEDVRFLVIILSNPSLYPQSSKSKNSPPPSIPWPSRTASLAHRSPARGSTSPKRPSPEAGREPGQHSGILKRIFGLLANSTDACHRYLISWFSRLTEARLTKMIDLVATFVTYRLSRQKVHPRHKSQAHDGGLIPDLSGSARQVSAQLQSATGISGGVKKLDDGVSSVVEYSEDWQLRAAAKVMALLFAANNTWQTKHAGSTSNDPQGNPFALQLRAKAHGQLLSTSDFYNTLLDYHDLIADFKAWESKKAKFAFCQYPFFLSMGSKIKILEYDAKRQMENKAREAYFDSVTNRRAMDGYFHLRVRRDCMVDDSLRRISEAVGADQEELKKGLRVQFAGEEGVDAGGLRKEWFLLLVRDIFDPNHGMFIYDEDSQTCYFNPNSFETSDQYYLVGALLGLAIYNSTILDVALPPFAYRKLLASAPTTTSTSSLPVSGSVPSTRGYMTYTVDDLAEYRPALADGLRQLLDYDGDVEATFCQDFVAPVERYGTVTNVPLCPNGEKKAVTNANRHEYVGLYVRYLLDAAVARQFEPFKRGFFTVCAGNALSLFRADEIELLVRGASASDALDVDSLRAVAAYENWRLPAPPHALVPRPADVVPVIDWFWAEFAGAPPVDQRKLLSFITGSDRIPAVGATSLVLRIVSGGDGTGRVVVGESERFPVARTCFNMLVLWRYETREKMAEKLWRAVRESEGFGLK